MVLCAPLSEHACRNLLSLGLSPRDVQGLRDRLAGLSGHAIDSARCQAALDEAAQAGDPVAVKLAGLPQNDPTVVEVALAYGKLQLGG